jgi:hypothetical protein
LEIGHFFIGKKSLESKGKNWLAESIKGGGGNDF